MNDIVKNDDPFNEVGKYVICRTYSAGVFAGTVEATKDQVYFLTDARRLWYWEGAASLSQLCMEGVKYPDKCKFPCTVKRVKLLEVIEVLDVEEKARKSIESVPIWQEK